MALSPLWSRLSLVIPTSQYQSFKDIRPTQFIFISRYCEKEKELILHSVSLELLNWFVGCSTSFNILIFSNLNSAGVCLESLAHIKYTKKFYY